MSGAPVTYRVLLDDLMLLADCADELCAALPFYVDRPAEQVRIARMIERLRGTIERASGYPQIGEH